MTVVVSDAVLDALESAPPGLRKAFFKQIKFLESDLHHPSLRAKKYDETRVVGKHGSIKTGDFISESLMTFIV